MSSRMPVIAGLFATLATLLRRLVGGQNGWFFHSPVLPSSSMMWARDAGLPLHSCLPSFAPCMAHSVAGKGRPTPDHAST
jgi:hypothetical protein